MNKSFYSLAISVLVLLAITSGCGTAEVPTAEDSPIVKKDKPQKSHGKSSSKQKNRTPAGDKKKRGSSGQKVPDKSADKKKKTDQEEEIAPLRIEELFPDVQPDPPVKLPRLKPADPQKVRAAGLRKIVGKHLILYTDLPKSEAIDQLPKIFDQAVPQWCAYFSIDPAHAEKWRVRACLMKDKTPFLQAGLMDRLPMSMRGFLYGYAQDTEIWLYEMPSDYYRRHLLLHEGTHAFMYSMMGGGAAPWYFEGLAEWLATHRFENDKLTLRQFPRSREDVPMLGRIKIVRSEIAAGRFMDVAAIINYSRAAHLKKEPYAWCWALAAFLDLHPQYQQPFRQLQQHVRLSDTEFNVRARELFRPHWAELTRQWAAFAGQIEHGHNINGTIFDVATGKTLPASGKNLSINAARGWQNSGVLLQKGQTYHITASGRYQIAKQPKIWWCEPGGVSIRYYRGRPIGMLLAGILPRQNEKNTSARPLPSIGIGLSATITPEITGTLLLRINDSPAELADNGGKFRVEVRPAAKAQ